MPVIEAFYKGLEDATGGAVKTEFHMGGAMGKGSETFERVLSGVSDIGHFGPGYTPGVFPQFDIFDYPIRFPSAEVLEKAMIEMYDRGYFDKDFSQVRVIGFHNIGPYVSFLASKRATALGDYKGLKLRVPSAGWVEVAKAIGGVPVAKPSSESYLNLQKGIVDGDFEPWDGVFVYKLGEVCQYVNDWSMMTFTHLYVINEDAWKAIPKAGKDYIEANWKKLSMDLAKAYDGRRPAASKKFLSYPGNEVIKLSPADYDKMNTLFAPIWDKYIADREAKGLEPVKALNDLYEIMTGLGVDNPIIGYTPR